MEDHDRAVDVLIEMLKTDVFDTSSIDSVLSGQMSTFQKHLSLLLRLLLRITIIMVHPIIKAAITAIVFILPIA